MPFDFNTVKDVLRCPQSRSPLIYDGEALICTDAECRLKYGIVDDIPILLIDEATRISHDDWSQAMAADPGADATVSAAD